VITQEEAIEIALRHVSGEVLQAQLDRENGILVWEVYIRNSYGVYEVKIDSNTGRVIEIERD
jgi:uncharacterized membrane protein YkoI